MTVDELYKAVDLSISQYRDMLSALERFGENLGQIDAERILAFSDELKVLQQQAALTDADIERGVSRLGGLDATLEAILERRLQMMKQVREHNQLLSEKIRGMMSVVSDELAQARAGKVAMTGYRGQEKGTGSILTGSF